MRTQMNHKYQSSDIYPLFDTFWNNTGFRGAGKLFGTRNENDALTFFKTLINDTESILYSFIAVK